MELCSHDENVIEARNNKSPAEMIDRKDRSVRTQ